MLLGVLGAVIARADDGTVAELGGPLRRALLAALLARGGRPVPVPTLIEDLWGESPPASAVTTLRSHVVRLRRDLASVPGGAEVIVTVGASYRVDVERHLLDSACFERDLHRGTELLASAEAEPALRRFDAALGWWRGEAYAEFAEAEFAVAERSRLAELHALAHERRFDAALLTGRGASLVSEIEARIASDPYRERLWEQLIIALYRADRPAEALAAYRRARTHFIDELGIEPGAELTRLNQRVLQQDDSLRGSAGHADITSVAGHQMAADSSTVCPYLGLACYEPSDSALFVGREDTVARLIARLPTTNPLVIAGDSGVGKSSLVRAGLLTALRADEPHAALHRTSDVIRPQQLFDDRRARVDVLIVDQAEDLFTAGRSAEQVDDAIGRLVEDGVHVVLVVRADCYGRLAELPVLGAVLGPATELVAPMSEAELSRVLVEPARRVALDVEPELVARVLADVRGHPSALPLVSTALLRTWQKRRGTVLNVAAYEAGGGVHGALEATAEDTYLGLSAPDQAAARRALVRMVTYRAGMWVRKPLPIAEANRLITSGALDALATGRLVTISAGQVELVHDALIEHWPRLRAWLDERTALAGLIETIETAARAWDVGGRQASDLIRGHRLASALEWSADYPDDATDVERAFLAASDEAAQSELIAVRAQVRREIRGRRRLRYLTALFATAALVATIGVVAALQSRSDEQRAARSADARRLAALSLTAPDLRTALLLAVAAQRLDPSDETRGALLSALQRTGTAIWRTDIPGRAEFAAVDTAGHSLWTSDQARTIYRYDIGTHRIVAQFGAVADSVAAVSPDGRQLVGVGQDGFFDTAGADRLTVVDASDGSHPHVLAVRAVGDGSLATAAAFTGDGRWLVVAVSAPSATPGASPPSSTYAIFDAADYAARPLTVRLDSPLRQLAVGVHDVATVSARGTIQLYDTTRHEVVRTARRAEFADAGSGPADYTIELSPDASQLAFTRPGDTSLVYLLSMRAGTAAPVPLSRLDAPVSSMTFSPTSRLLAASADDGSVEVFHTADGTLAARPLGSAPGQATHLAWAGTAGTSGTPAHDGQLFAAGHDGKLLALDTSSGLRLVTGHGAQVPEPFDVEFVGDYAVAFEPQTHGGATLPVQIVHVDSGAARTVAVRMDPTASIQAVTVDARADRALVVTQDRKSILQSAVYDLGSGRLLGHFAETGVPSQHNSDVGVISADGRTAAYAIAAHRMALVALPSGRRLFSFDVTFTGPAADRHWVSPLRFAPDGRVLVMGFDAVQSQPDAGPENQLVGIVNMQTRRLDGQIGGFGEVGFPTAAAWSPDGSIVAIGSAAGVVRVARAPHLQPIGGPVQAASAAVSSIGFSPDGATVLTSGADGQLAFWDSHTLQQIGQPLIAPRHDAWIAAYRADGIVTGYEPVVGPGSAQWFTLPARPQDWVSVACRFAGDSLSRSEWSHYVGGRPYQQLCPSR